MSARPLNVVLIGGTGFIGSHLAARLSDDGVGVLVLARHYESAKQLCVLPGVDVEVANIHDDATLRRLLAGRDAVINLVGVLHGGHGRPYGEGFRRLHVELPRRIAAACAATGVPRYLHMSALGADPAHASSRPSMYLRSKSDGELAARSQPQVAATVFRPSVVFGPGDHFLTMFARLQRHLPLVPLAASRARFQPVYVGDVAAAFSIALARRATRNATIALGGPAVYSLDELVRLAGRYAGCERQVLGLPDWAARLQAGLFELLPGEPLLSRDNLDSMRVDNVVAAGTDALRAPRKTVASGSSLGREAQSYGRTASIANRKCNAQQVFEVPLTAEALGIKLTAIESVAPHYLAGHDRHEAHRTYVGR